MSKFGQFGIILGILFLSEFLQMKFDLPIPAAILGMMILLFLMIVKVIKLEWVEDISDIFLDNLGILFIPASVGMIRNLDIFKGKIIILAIITLITTSIVIVVTGVTISFLEKNKGKDKL